MWPTGQKKLLMPAIKHKRTFFCICIDLSDIILIMNIVFLIPLSLTNPHCSFRSNSASRSIHQVGFLLVSSTNEIKLIFFSHSAGIEKQKQVVVWNLKSTLSPQFPPAIFIFDKPWTWVRRREWKNVNILRNGTNVTSSKPGWDWLCSLGSDTFLYINVHPVQGSRVTQGRLLLVK